MAETPVDFFISYTAHDTSWAKWLDWILREEGHTTRVQMYDFVPGENFVDEVQRSLSGCRTVMCVLSKQYLSSRWCNEEWQSALRERKLLPVRIDDCEPGGLVGLRTFIELDGLLEESTARQRVLDAVRLRHGADLRPLRNPGYPAGNRNLTAIRFPARLPPLWSVPHARNPNFTGRGDLLQDLHNGFANDTAHILTQSVRGLGGVGKTQLALEYAYRYGNEYEGVLWLRSEEPSALAGEYAALAEQMEEFGKREPGRTKEADIQAVRRALAERGRVLHIFDNAVDPAQLAQFLPLSGLARVLVTTRATSWPSARRLAVQPLDVEASIGLLVARTGDTDVTAAGDIARMVGGLPLALEQAAAYVESRGKTLRAYASLLSTHGLDVLERGKAHDYDSSVGRTWAIAMSSLEDQPRARQLLNFCAFLAPDAISTDDFVEAAQRLPSPLDELFRSELELDDAKAALLRFSLVRADDRYLSVHRLVQTVVRDGLAPDERLQWRGLAMGALLDVFPDATSNPKTWETCRRLLSHAIVATEPQEAEQVNAATTRILTKRVGGYLMSQGQFATAERYFRRALEIAQRTLDAGDPKLAHAQSFLGQALNRLRRYTEAEALYRSAIEIYERTQDAGLSSRLSDLGALLGNTGRYSEGEALMRRAIDVCERLLGPQHPKVATRLINLGVLLVGDRAAEREELYRRALLIHETALGPDAPDVAEALRHLGSVLTDTGRAVEAEPLLRRALAIDEAAYGAEHHWVHFDLVVLAEALHRMNQQAEAEPLARRAIALVDATYEADHPNSRHARKVLEVIQRALGSTSS